ncbi:MAG: hypothetical protein GYA21_18960 [Myxococcales bacterium]|nr:hypothetical protein [Myxococcales bacterium]
MLGTALLLLVDGGCGYRFSAGEARLPGGGRELNIAPVESAIAEAGWGGELGERLQFEARRAGLVLSADPAAPRLRARLLSLETIPRGIAAGGGRFAAREEEVRLSVEIVWQEGPTSSPPRFLREGESFVVAPELRGTQTNRALAVRRALQRLAERIVNESCRGFAWP